MSSVPLGGWKLMAAAGYRGTASIPGPLHPKWIRSPLASNGGLGSMTRQNADFVIEGHHTSAHRCHQILPRSAGKIGPAHASRKQLVTREEQSFVAVKETTVTWSVSRGVDDLERDRTEIDDVAALEMLETLRNAVLTGRCHAEQQVKLRLGVESEEVIVRVNVGPCSCLPAQRPGATGVIYVTMGQNDGVGCEFVSRKEPANWLGIGGSVDHNGESRVGVCQDPAVGLGDPERNRLDEQLR